MAPSPNKKGARLRKPQHRNQTVTDKNTGIQYVATGAQDPGTDYDRKKKERKVKFTLKNLALSMGKSTTDAMRIGVVLVSVLSITWYASAFPGVQDMVQDARIIHGAADLLRRNPTESSGVPYMVLPYAARWMTDHPGNQRAFQEEGGLLPLIHLVHEDKVDMLTRMTMDVMGKALESDYVWEHDRIDSIPRLIVQTLVHSLTTGKRRVCEEAAAAILASLYWRDQFQEVIHREGINAIKGAMDWTKDRSLAGKLQLVLDDASRRQDHVAAAVPPTVPQ